MRSVANDPTNTGLDYMNGTSEELRLSTNILITAHHILLQSQFNPLRKEVN